MQYNHPSTHTTKHSHHMTDFKPNMHTHTRTHARTHACAHKSLPHPSLHLRPQIESSQPFPYCPMEPPATHQVVLPTSPPHTNAPAAVGYIPLSRRSCQSRRPAVNLSMTCGIICCSGLCAWSKWVLGDGWWGGSMWSLGFRRRGGGGGQMISRILSEIYLV